MSKLEAFTLREEGQGRLSRRRRREYGHYYEQLRWCVKHDGLRAGGSLEVMVPRACG